MNETVSDLAVRRARAEDADAVFEICRRTGDSGRDATALFSNPLLPGYLWAVAYLSLEPDFAFVLANPDRAVGYTLAAPDSAAFDRRLEAEWWPYVAKQLAGFQPKTFDDARLMERIGKTDPDPEWLLAGYPAHMHINILPEAQGLGWGRRMIDVQLAALKAHGVAGVHLGVLSANKPAMTFYRHLGFDDISRDGRVIFGKRLSG